MPLLFDNIDDLNYNQLLFRVELTDMGVKISTEKDFVDHYIELSIDQKSFLAKVEHLIDWEPFIKYLAHHLEQGPAAAGQAAYPDLLLF